MNMRKRSSSALGQVVALALVFAAAGAAWALVNPTFQPSHVVRMYRNVLGGEIAKVDWDGGRVTWRVTRVFQGDFAPKEITIEVPAPDPAEAADTAPFLEEAREGAAILAYVGKPRAGHEGDALVYTGHSWHACQMSDTAKPAEWKWTEDMSKDGEGEMWGTFNGSADQLVALMDDMVAGRDWFPPYPLVKFKDDLNVATFEGAVRGVALYDLNGDGRLDLYACNEKGNRAFLQGDGLSFADATQALGLAGVASASCSFADVDLDGRADLLVDGVIWRGLETGFAKSDLLPASAAERVKVSAFVEINGDGYPDVVVSRVEGGLSAYLNPGEGAAAGTPFADATSAAGLDRPECGAGATGFFAPGDFSGDGRTDLYYAVGQGLLLVQDAGGVFAPVPSQVRFDYSTSGTKEPGMTGAGGFAPLWKPDRWDLVAAGDMNLSLITREDATARDVTGEGNESRLAGVNQLATLPADLNADGYPDLYTISRDAGTKNSVHENRGYGSYMLSELYLDYDAFPGKSHETGAGGAAAGDVDGDGADDLLLGGMDGVLRLVLSDTLNHALRQPKEHPTALEQKLQGFRILSVRFGCARGVVGAGVRIADAAGRIVCQGAVGWGALTGCRGPDAVNLVVREPGAYTATVRFADGATRSWPVDLTTERHVTFQADRP